MLKHIGRKVRGLFMGVCAAGIIASAAAGISLYLTKRADAGACIAIAAGGALLSWISSWALYCIGDTHVKIERLEEKLIPKPAYAEYLAGNTPARGACEICGRTTDLIDAKIEDKMGVRYRKVCKECFAANHCTEKE